MTKFAHAVLLLLLFAVSVAEAQQTTVTDTEIETAIATGLREKGKMQGLLLVDVTQRFFAGMATANAPSANGYVVHLYSPLTWIKQQASNAAKEYRNFTRSDVTAEMLNPVIRVVVYPSTPTHVIAAGTAMASSVEHVVLRDASRQMAVQPLEKEVFTEEVSNAIGGKATYAGVTAVFALQDVQQVRAANEEFLVTVVGSNGDKDFKVKRKHFDKLFAEGISPAKRSSPQPTARSTRAPKPSTPLPNSMLAEKDQQPQPSSRASGEVKSLGPTSTNEKPASPDRARPMIAEPTARAAATSSSSDLPAPQSTGEGSIGAWSDEKPRVRHDGIRISTVIPNGPADQASLEVGDYILALDGHYFFTVEDLNAEIRSHAPGSRVSLRYRRYTTIYDTYVVMGTTAH